MKGVSNLDTIFTPYREMRIFAVCPSHLKDRAYDDIKTKLQHTENVGHAIIEEIQEIKSCSITLK